MRSQWIIGPMVVMLVLSRSASPQSTNTTETFAFADYYTNHPPMTVNQRVDQFSVQLIARMAGGTNVFDQTFNAAYTDSAVQAAIAQAMNDLTNAGAASVSGPTLLSNAVSLVSTSSVSSERLEEREPIIWLEDTLGPATNLIGYLGTCESYIVTTNGGVIMIGLTGGNPETFVVRSGTINLNTISLIAFDRYPVTTNTESYLTSQVYELIGGGPLLNIERVAGGQVRVFWERPAIGYVLEQASVLGTPSATTLWDQVAFPYETNATHISITVAPTGNRFYRLRWPP